MQKKKKPDVSEYSVSRDLTREVSIQRLKKIRESPGLDGDGLEDISTLLIEGRISDLEAKRLSEKPIIKHGLKENTGWKPKVIEDGDVLKVVSGEDERLEGRMVYEMRVGGPRNIMFIHEIFVEPGYRREGRGELLIDYAARMARREKMESMMLEVDRHNNGAIQFFEENGFRETGGWRNPNIDRIIMNRDVK